MFFRYRRRVDERDLSCALMLADTAHFGRAARRLNLTQPALTRRLAELERRLGTTLFVRDRAGVRPTAAGQAFLVEARPALRHAEAARRAAVLAGQGLTGTLRLGFTIVLLYRGLPQAVRRFRATYPDVVLELHEMISPLQEAALLDGRLDLGLVHPPLERDGIGIRPLADEPLWLAIPPGNPLGLEVGPLPLSTLEDVPLLLPPRAIGPYLNDRILAACRAAGFAPRVVQESAPMTTTIGLVAAGLGCAFVARSMTALRPEGVTYRPILADPLTLPCTMAWSDATGIAPAADRFAAMAAEV